jgi:hypothetical protein
MSRIKLVLLSMFAVVAVGAIASSSASAAPHWLVCVKVAPGTGHFTNSECTTSGAGEWATKELPEPLELEGTSGVSKLSSEIGSTKVTIKCLKDKFAGTIEAPGNSTATITYEECSFEGAAGCTVKSPTQPAGTIVAKVLDRLVEKEGKVLDEFFEKTGVAFTTIEIGVCALKSTLEVKGTQKCELPSGEVFKRLHEIECLATGSSLKLGTKEATYEGNASIQLKDLVSWRVSK